MARVTMKFALVAVMAAAASHACATDSASTTVTLSNLTMQLGGSTGYPPSIVFGTGETSVAFLVGPSSVGYQTPGLFAEHSESVAYRWGTGSASSEGDPLSATATVVTKATAIADPGAPYLSSTSDSYTLATFTLSPFTEVTFSGIFTVTSDVTNPVGQSSGMAVFAFLGARNNSPIYEFRLGGDGDPGSNHMSQTEQISGGVINGTDAPQSWLFEFALDASASVNSVPEPPAGLLLALGAGVLRWWRAPLALRRRHGAATAG